MQLKPNSHGFINKKTVFGLKLSDKLYSQVGRIIEELIELDEELNFEEFCRAMEILINEEKEKTCPTETMEVPNEYD